MGEGAARVMSASEDVRRVSGEIETLRGELGTLVAELDRRRHEALDLGLQVRRHPAVVAVVAGLAAIAVGGLIAFAVRSRRERRRPTVRAREARRALARLLEHPERVASPEPNLPGKVARALAVAAASTLAKRLVERAVRPARPARARV